MVGNRPDKQFLPAFMVLRRRTGVVQIEYSFGFGPGDENQAHAPNEINRVDDLEICAAFYTMLPYVLEGKA